MTKEHITILTSLQVEQKLQRIARQLVELHYNKKEIIIIGISERGVKIAKKINSILNNITKINIKLLTLKIDKDHPIENQVELSESIETLNEQTVVLIDDVLNSGKTLIHAASYLVQANIAQLSTVVLVDRRHRLFPIRADFVGMTLSTTLKEHISVVEIKKDTFEVYLK
jgi:pyrimidine operon attenuation protein/uracil phosphoribosyltransferase